MSRLVYGLHPLKERLRRRNAGISAIWVDAARASRDSDLKALLAQLPDDISAQRVSRDQLARLCQSPSHQGVVAAVGDYIYVDLDDLLEGSGDDRPDTEKVDIDNLETHPAPKSSAPLLLIVDGVTDPQNLGAMLRSALVLGATGVVLTRDRCAQITPTVVRISSGASEHLACARVTNLARALEHLKDLGVWIFGTVEAGGQPPASIDLTGPSALVLGSEGKGMRPNIRRHCDALITLPTPGPIVALNVAAATTAIFYEAARQRSES
ncbi:MAG: 23S rRNA (guanosine(2251)-2'-O)-methyltransferase RlmB [Deltaproteobacteria bacterium]|nr:23S rRNA (guanosine(2251)-2'-O)-methyltransferase RlmB [Deltaproteobacteria bacterium]